MPHRPGRSVRAPRGGLPLLERGRAQRVRPRPYRRCHALLSPEKKYTLIVALDGEFTTRASISEERRTGAIREAIALKERNPQSVVTIVVTTSRKGEPDELSGGRLLRHEEWAELVESSPSRGATAPSGRRAPQIPQPAVPKCGAKNVLTPENRARGDQCNSCADAAEGIGGYGS